MVAAGRLFSAQGYGATSVRDIAAACEMRVASLYSHFPGKDAILAELIVRYYDALLPRVRAINASPGSGATRLARLIEATLEVSMTRRFEFMAPFNEWTKIARAPWRDTLVAAREEAMAIARQALCDGIADGSLSADIDVEMTLRLIVVGVAGIVDHRYAYSPLSRDFDPTAAYVNFVMRSLRP